MSGEEIGAGRRPLAVGPAAAGPDPAAAPRTGGAALLTEAPPAARRALVDRGRPYRAPGRWGDARLAGRRPPPGGTSPAHSGRAARPLVWPSVRDGAVVPP